MFNKKIIPCILLIAILFSMAAPASIANNQNITSASIEFENGYLYVRDTEQWRAAVTVLE